MINDVQEGIRIAAVDAFTTTPLSGNGAGVVLLEQPADAPWMQQLAAELNQSETAFLWSDSGTWRLRWFTPTCEVRLCGHGTLAAAIALQHWGLLDQGRNYPLHTMSGALQVHLHAPGQASVELPSGELQDRDEDTWMSSATGEKTQRCWTSPLGYGVILLPATANLESLDPDHHGWAEGPEVGWVVMQAGHDDYDYRLRFFAPGLGLREDPVTGSAHSLVAPWWCRQLAKTTVRGWQPSHRPGELWATPLNSGMIRLQGSAVILWEGRLLHQPAWTTPLSWRGSSTD